ncbi:MAG: hypothetical protein JWP45_2692 [Mucilaginibacter sp.]|nr:hypothetical protein [Mucilaginibacter sp.]
MKTNRFSIILMIAFSLISCKRSADTKKSYSLPDSTNFKKHKWLKEYALCSCIKFSFKDDEAIKSDLSFTVYKGITDYGSPLVYRTIDSASKKAAFSIQPSQIADFNGKKAMLSGCINYYESLKLDSLVKSFDRP